MITENLEDYEQLACLIATTPEILLDVKKSVERARSSAPMFDTDAFARNLEQLYRDMMVRQ